MKLFKGTFGWHSNKQIFKTDVCKLSGKKFADFPITLTNYPKKFPPFINLDCPFFFQDQINTCGETSVKMLVSFQMLHFKSNFEFSKQLRSINDFISKKRGFFKGTTDEDMNKMEIKSMFLPNQIKNNVKDFSSWVAYSLYHLGPLIITINIFNGRVAHFVVVKGIENNTLLLHDPWYGADQFLHYNNFFKVFNDNTFMFLPNKSLNKLYPSRENEIICNLFYCDKPKPIPLLKSTNLIKSILV
ncbi:cysteine peptidase family C39 domain-containing protein [Spirobacillus cienkowskii]|uniref:cysteine peptidase family C39 domain-containing protein n=1 Tax=Spirobacillus cienkowskii TaxID=495820 RepID=UPI0030CFAD9D